MTTIAGSRKTSEAMARVALSVFVAMLIPTAVFALIAVEISEADRRGWDETLFPSWTHVRAWWADAVMTFVSLIGGGKGLLVVASILIGVLLAERRYGDVLLVTLAVNGAAVLGRAFKDALDRPRPEMARSVFGVGGKAIALIAVSCVAIVFWTRWRRLGLAIGGAFAILLIVSGLIDLWQTTPGYDSFPSGHAVSSMALVGACVVLAWPTRLRRLAVAGGVVLLVVVGLSRVYFGLHYTSDVIGGWALALAWVALLTGVRAIRRERMAAAATARVG